MRHDTQALFGYQLACDTINAIGLVLYAYKCSLKLVYKLALTLGKACGFFFVACVSSFFKHLECCRCIGYVISVILDYRAIALVFFSGFFELLYYQLFELLQLFI